MREAFVGDIVVKDRGEIPSGVRFAEQVPCLLAHPGLCPAQTPLIYEAGCSASERMTDYLVANCSVGSVLSFGTVTPTAEFF